MTSFRTSIRWSTMLCISMLASACVVEAEQAPAPLPEAEASTQEQVQPTQEAPQPQPQPDPQPAPKPEPAPDPGSSSTQQEESSDSETLSPAPEPEPVHLQYMMITPGNKVIEQDLGKETTLSYSVKGYYSDGREEDISDKVTWSISNPQVGSFTQSELRLAAHNQLFVDTAIVSATLDKVQARSQITVAAYEQDGANPDFLFILPYQDSARSTAAQTLSFQTKIPSMDVFFSVDSTGSMYSERDQLLATIKTSIVPAVQSKIPNTQFGVASFQDFPVGGHGSSGDQPFVLHTPITADINAVTQGVEAIGKNAGADVAESLFESLYQIATGEGLSGPGATKVDANHSGVGGVGFRKQSMPVIISVTDAPSHDLIDGEDKCQRKYNAEVAAVAHSFDQTQAALNKICARVITVASDGYGGANFDECRPEHDGRRLANATKTRVSPLAWNGQRPTGCAEGHCCTGKDGAGELPDADGMCPLVYRVDSRGRGLDTSIVSGIEALAFYAPFNVISETHGESLAGGKTTDAFIQEVIAAGFSDLPRPELPAPIAAHDRFNQVTPGTKLNFTIRAYNDIVRPTSKAQIFRAKVRVVADQCEGLDLDERELVFVVPPRELVAG